MLVPAGVAVGVLAVLLAVELIGEDLDGVDARVERVGEHVWELDKRIRNLEQPAAAPAAPAQE